MFIEDPSGILSASDYASIKTVSSPLDVKVIVTSADSKPGLDMHVHDLVTSANTLAIGVDPIHHYTFTHFGTGTGIQRGDYQGVARAGNGEFHAGNWAAGIRAIVNAANAASSEGEHGTVLVTEPTTVVEHPAASWPYLVGFGVLAAICLVAWRWMRRKSIAIEKAAQEARDEAQEMRSRNIEEQGWHDKMAAKMPATSPVDAPVLASAPPSAAPRQPSRLRSTPRSAPPRYIPAPTYAPAAIPLIVNQGSNDGLLAGVLLGEAMSRPAVVEREVVHESPRYERDTGSDAGSSSSSFDSGSSFDGGSGGGGFDSGGGGGGFDGGGGGGGF